MPAEPDRLTSASDRRNAARTAVLWDGLGEVLQRSTGPGDVLDIGGGTGGFAVRVAELGHRVAVIDPSPDALAALSRRAHERGVADLVTGQQGDLSSLAEVVPPASVDVVLCHGVLEVIDDPVEALAQLASVLRPGGTLSILVAQQHAAVVARAMAGHFVQARELLDPASEASLARRRFSLAEITAAIHSAGLGVETIHGIRTFADLVPGSLLDLEPGSTQALLDLERAVAGRSEYLPLATQLHLIARR